MPLTPRQQDVLTRVSRGMSNKEIAQELHILPNSVKAHVTALFKAFKVVNRTQLAIVMSNRTRAAHQIENVNGSTPETKTET